MPRISEFYGIIVFMYWNDHNPPHLHAVYGDQEVLININDFSVYAGEIPGRALGLLMEWIFINKEALLRNWDLLSNNESPEKIEPLK